MKNRDTAMRRLKCPAVEKENKKKKIYSAY
jgi:hypothetical protein